MLLGRDHTRDRERRQQLRLVLEMLDLEPDHGELVGELLDRLVSVEMVLQPGQREFHGCVPRVLLVIVSFALSWPLASLSPLPPPLWGRVGEGGKPRARRKLACRIA